MMIVMKSSATEEEVQSVIDRIEEVGARAHPSRGEEVTVIGAIGDREHVMRLGLEGAPGVEQVVPILKPYKLASAQIRPEPSVIEIDGRRIGGEHFSMIAGPCTVESRDQTLGTARTVKAAGGSLFRGGAYKPRTSPYAFQGLGQEGLRLLAEAKAETGLPIVTECMDARDLEAVLEVADVIQIGARNMQNYPLLAEIGRSGRPALLKRGASATLEELLMAAEYILKEGNPNVLLCERGIRTFETAYRYTLDLTAVPVLKELTHLPVIVDPSHAAGRRSLVTPLSLAAAAAGADGIIVEVHPEPEHAICDGPQALVADGFADYVEQVERAAAVAGKVLSSREGLIVAVLGVGLVGGSVGLAARERLDAEVRGYRPRARGARPGARARRDHDHLRLARRGARGCRGGVRRRAGARAAGRGGGGAGCRRAGVRGDRRRLDQARAVGAVDDHRFIGGHPLAGAETAGVEHARAGLFDGATWYLTPTPRTEGVLYERLYRLLADLGARPAAIDAETHDRLMASVSHLPHVLANVLVAQTVRALESERLPPTGPSFRDATRVAGASSAIWRDIYISNADALVAAIDDTVRRLGEIRDGAGRPRRGRGGGLERRRPRRPPAAARGRPRRRRGGRAARVGAEPARRGGRGRARARAGIGQHRRHGAVSGGGQHDWLDALWIAGEADAAEAEGLIGALGFTVARP